MDACIECSKLFASRDTDIQRVKDLVPAEEAVRLGNFNPCVHGSCYRRYHRTAKELVDRALLICNAKQRASTTTPPPPSQRRAFV